MSTLRAIRQLLLAAIAILGSIRDVAAQDAAPLPPLPSAVASGRKLTLSQALEIGQKQNPNVDAAEHTAKGARANLSGQRQPLNPVFTFASLNNSLTPLDIHSFGSPSNYSVTLPIEISGRQNIRKNVAAGQYQASAADLQTARITVRESVAGAYISLQVANASLTSEQEAYAVAKRLSDLTEQQFKLGAAPETNAIRTRIALTQEEQNLYQAISSVNLDRSGLNVAMGRAPETPVDTAEPLTFPPVTLSLKQIQDKALTERPEIRSAEATDRSLKATEQMEHSQYFPDLYVGADLKVEEVLVGVSLPLFDFGSIRGAIRTAREAVRTQDAQIKLARVSAMQDVANAYYTLVAAQQTVSAFEDGILPRAVSLESRIEQGYKLGGNTILDLIDAQETLRQTRLAYNTALGNFRGALAQLERAVGGPIPGAPDAVAPVGQRDKTRQPDFPGAARTSGSTR